MSTSLTAATDSQILRYLVVSELSFLTWDTIIHLGDEIEFIWLGPNTWMKFVYLFIRYFPIIALSLLLPGVHLPGLSCNYRLDYEEGLFQAVIIAVEVILVVRVYALYNSNKIVLWVLSVLFTAEIATMITTGSLSGVHGRYTTQCYVTSEPALFLAYWLSSLMFETVLFGLTLAKTISSVRQGLNRNTLLYILLRDSTWAFALIFVIMLINTLMYLLNHTPLSGMFYFWAIAINSFAGAHVLLNLRRFIPRPAARLTASGLVFAGDSTSNYTTRSSKIATYDLSDRTADLESKGKMAAD